jgi:hypothetical protein
MKKRPVKKRRLLPLGIKDPMKTELPALVALEAIGKPYFSEMHLADLLVIALVSEVLAVKGSFIHLIAGELKEALQAPELNLEVIRPLVCDISAWLQVQDNGRVDTAIEQLMRQQSRQSA